MKICPNCGHRNFFRPGDEVKCLVCDIKLEKVVKYIDTVAPECCDKGGKLTPPKPTLDQLDYDFNDD